MATSSIFTFDERKFLSASTSVGNLFLGLDSGSGITSAYGVTAFGNYALVENSTGIENTAFGYKTLMYNTTGQLNTGIGYRALHLNVDGNDNTALGYKALFNSTSGSRNTVGGSFASFTNTTGSDNTAQGYGALFYNTTGSSNTAIGHDALYYNNSATSTVAVGSYAAQGNSVLYSNQGGTYVGYYAGYNAGTGSDYNTLIGYRAGYNISTGSNNILIGTATSSTNIANLTTGNQNILIGNNISLPNATANGQLNIGNIIFGTSITGTGSTISSGNIGIGTTSPGSKLQVVSSGGFTPSAQTVASFQRNGSTGSDAIVSIIAGAAANSVLWFGDTDNENMGRIYYNHTNNAFNIGTNGSSDDLTILSSGNVGIGTTTPWRTLSVTGTVGFDGLTGSTGAGSVCLSANKEIVYNSGSDSCLSSTRATKHDILPLDLSALDMVTSLQPVSFIYNNDASSTVRYGFIAEDAAAVDAHLATYDAQGAISGIDDRSVIALTVRAVQSLISTISEFADRFTTRELTFTRASGDEITVRKANIQQANVQELCVGSTCLTESQVQALLNQAGQQPSAPSETPQESQSEEPQADEPVLPATPEEPAEADNPIPEISDAPPTAPDDTPEEIPVTEPTDDPVAQ